MKIPWKPNDRFGDGPTPRIFLSASVPSLDRDKRFLKGAIEPRLMARVIETRVRDAVASFAVQLLRAGGQLIFGGHPAIVPMVAAAAEHFTNGRADAFPVVLYQSERFRDATPPAGREEMESWGIAKIEWVPVDRKEAAEKFKIQTPYLLNDGRFKELHEREQHDKKAPPGVAAALVVLRVIMVLHLRPEAILSMGGMEGIGAEASLFKELQTGRFDHLQFRVAARDRPENMAFALKSTYGATADLSSQTHFIDERFFAGTESPFGVAGTTLLKPEENMNIIEKQLMERIRYDGIMEQFIQEVAGP